MRARRVASAAFPVVLAGALCSCVQPPQQEPAGLTTPVLDPAVQQDAAETEAVADVAPQQASLAPDALPAPAPASPPSGPGGGTVGTASLSPPSHTDSEAVAPASVPETPVLEEPAEPPPAFVAVPLRPEDEPEIDSDPTRLFGMAEEDLRRLLGVPQFVRIDGPTRLWRYRAEVCLLDLFLYPDDTDESPFRVFHFEARGADNGEAPAGSCLEALLRARPRA